MAVAAPEAEQTLVYTVAQPSVESYGESFRNARLMGNLAARGAGASPEYIGARQEVWFDFKRAVGENLATDPEYGESLLFDPMEEFDVVGSKMVDKQGQALEDTIKEGWRKAREEAKTNPEMVIQAERDEGDVITMHIVDRLEQGEMYAAISMDPKAELKKNPDFWRDGRFNYREGLAVLEVFYRLPSGKILAGTYSIKSSDETAVRTLLTSRGLNIPPNESLNRFIRYGIRQTMSEQEVRRFGHGIIREHADLIKKPAPKLSVTDLLEAESSQLEQYFAAYYLPLSTALASGQNQPELQSFAGAALNNPVILKKLAPSQRQQLMRINNSRQFTDNDAKLVEKVIRYGVVEDIRQKIPGYLNSSLPPRPNQTAAPSPVFQAVPLEQVAAMNQRLTVGISAGIQAERSYGGCSGASLNEDDLVNNPLEDMHGLPGLLKGEKQEKKYEESDKFGSLKFDCPKCKKENKREKNDWVYECKSCGADVSCGRKKPEDMTENKKQSAKVISMASFLAGKRPRILSNAA